MARTMANGIVNEPSSHSVDQTVERLKSLLQASGAVLFGLVDHSGEAEKVGLKMKPTKLLIFGNPKAGTPLMVASPALPLTFRSRCWSGKMLQMKCGFLTTVQNICRSGMDFRKICCQIYLSFANWHPKEPDKCALFLSIKNPRFQEIKRVNQRG